MHLHLCSDLQLHSGLSGHCIPQSALSVKLRGTFKHDREPVGQESTHIVKKIHQDALVRPSSNNFVQTLKYLVYSHGQPGKFGRLTVLFVELVQSEFECEFVKISFMNLPWLAGVQVQTNKSKGAKFLHVGMLGRSGPHVLCVDRIIGKVEIEPAKDKVAWVRLVKEGSAQLLPVLGIIGARGAPVRRVEMQLHIQGEGFVPLLLDCRWQILNVWD